ncbi:L,D-transpeptidase family protein [Sphingomonas sp. ac-8]|uniref:L,D-transpeptidase family protein n=1 Tax=Sphingomonas sp. ac-8 TaxID=3242977 RepID=UPI003A7F83E8
MKIGNYSAWLAAGALALSLQAAPAVAQEPAAVFGVSSSQAMKPGQYVWKDIADTSEPVTVTVSLALQRAYVYRGSTLIAVSTVSTGKPGHETPIGEFEILQKKEMHRSNLYNDAPMPYMQRLTWDGIALHAGAIPGRPASHGCVRLPAAFAKKLFAATAKGAMVSINDDPYDPLSPIPLPAENFGASTGTVVASQDVVPGRSIRTASAP